VPELHRDVIVFLRYRDHIRSLAVVVVVENDLEFPFLKFGDYPMLNGFRVPLNALGSVRILVPVQFQC